jgi:hypothetical protein
MVDFEATLAPFSQTKPLSFSFPRFLSLLNEFVCQRYHHGFSRTNDLQPFIFFFLALLAFISLSLSLSLSP